MPQCCSRGCAISDTDRYRPGPRVRRPLVRAWAGLLLAAGFVAACAPGPIPTGTTNGPSDTPEPSVAVSAGTAALSAAPIVTPAPTPAPLHAGCPATTVNNRPSTSQRSLHAATTNWSGYVARSTRSFSCIEGSWTQPAVSCPANGSASLAMWIGLDGESGPSRATLEQIGTNTDCVAGHARSFAWFEVLPADRFEQELSLPVDAGDKIAASIGVVGRSYKMVIENLTTGDVVDTFQHSPGAKRLTAEWVVEAPTVGCPSDCQVALLASFGTASFTSARVVLAGVTGPIGDGRWTRVRLDLESRSGIVKSKPGVVARDGASFAVVWHHR
jgi:hypothetical protein